MTPDEFRDRAAVAVAPLDPSPASYEWLRANVDRRRRRTRVAWTVAAATAAAVVAVAFVVLPSRDHTAPPVVEPASTAPTAEVRTAAIDGDVDGDGKTDVVDVVRQGDPGDAHFRFGVTVAMSGTGQTLAVMGEPGAGANDAQEVVGVVDVDRDGRAEVVVRVGTSVGTAYYQLATLVDRELRWIVEDTDRKAPALFEFAEAGQALRGWGCGDERPDRPGHELYRIEVDAAQPRHSGWRRSYVLRRGVLADMEGLGGTWSPAFEPVPPRYVPAVSCGSVTP